MSNSDNPYAPPTAQPAGSVDGGFEQINERDVKKIEAIIKDASQFWLALLLCLFCTLIGMLLIGPWYLTRLLQWNAMARLYPRLLNPDASAGGLAQRFQSSKWKLIAGLVGGLLLALAIGSVFILSTMIAPSQP